MHDQNSLDHYICNYTVVYSADQNVRTNDLISTEIYDLSIN